MKKILFGMAFMAGLASCSKENVLDEDDKVKTGLYKAVTTFSSSTADEKMPVNVSMAFVTEGNLYTYNPDGTVKKIDGKVYNINEYASVKDTTITVFTDNNNILSVSFTAVSTEDGNKLSYDMSIYRNEEKVETFKEEEHVLNSGEDKTIIY